MAKLKVYKFNSATIRIGGRIDIERVRQATIKYLKKIESKRKGDKRK